MVFDRLRKAVKSFSKSVVERVQEKVSYREIKEDDISDLLDELLFSLVEADVAYDVAEDIVESVRRALVGKRIERGKPVEEVVKEAIKGKLLEILDKPRPDIIGEAKARCGGSPLVVVFLGVNGVGKTTSIAKLAYKLKKAGITPVLAAADTFRAGAQEQLKTHAERLGVPVLEAGYGRDPASVAVDAINYARSRGYCVVLVDTAGRMHVDTDLMAELRKIIRVSKPDYRILVVDSLTGNDAVEQARLFNEQAGLDGVILTKTDADVKGGTAISVAAVTGKPILYTGTGQSYEDLEEFDPKKFVEKILES